ncbi:unnamed protein product [Effrenium voratum]|nr:unnamed protein product [Effrenium voratum]
MSSSAEEELRQTNVKTRVYRGEGAQKVDIAMMPVRRIPGFACDPGTASLLLAHDYCLGKRRKLPPPAAPEWDYGLLLMLQFLMGCLVLTILAAGVLISSRLADTYWYMRFIFDTKWGFALAEGYSYTAPVWMGEFGQMVRGNYWLNMLRYLADRDVDFAYWPLNGLKYSEGYFTKSGDFVQFDHPRWEDEAFGLLMNDSWTIRHTWKLLDIQVAGGHGGDDLAMTRQCVV